MALIRRFTFLALLIIAVSWPFTGRDDELEVGTSALADAIAGGRRCVLIGGEPGVGKTWLSAAAIEYARSQRGHGRTSSAIRPSSQAASRLRRAKFTVVCA